MFLATQGRLSATILRIVLAVVIFPHGAQKVLGLFGGGGFQGTIRFFSENLGIPTVLTVLVMAAELLGSIGLFLGFLTRFCALAIGGVMVGAVLKVHAANGFFMNWSGAQAGEGFEFHLLALAMCAVLALEGGGRFSVDRSLAVRSIR